MIAKARQVHWRSVQVASESMEPFGVVVRRLDPDTMTPLDALQLLTDLRKRLDTPATRSRVFPTTSHPRGA
jgi:hypothetical protein